MYKKSILITLTIIWIAFIFFIFLSYTNTKPIGQITKEIKPVSSTTTNMLIIGATFLVFFIFFELINYTRENKITKR